VEHAETVLVNLVLPLKLAVELIGVIVIGIGCLKAVVELARRRLQPGDPFTGLRLSLANYLALGLEFQLAADILSTAISPSWGSTGSSNASLDPSPRREGLIRETGRLRATPARRKVTASAVGYRQAISASRRRQRGAAFVARTWKDSVRTRLLVTCRRIRALPTG
jgi:uncharacterized membrane protein